MTTWFCEAYESWQKGGVENANGRLRRQESLKTLARPSSPPAIHPKHRTQRVVGRGEDGF